MQPTRRPGGFQLGEEQANPAVPLPSNDLRGCGAEPPKEST